MLPKVQGFVTQTTQQIDQVIRDEVSFRSNIFKSVKVGSWRDDPILKVIISDFKKQSQLVSQSFVKLSFLINPKTNFEDKVMSSIFEEIIQQLQILTNIFWRCLECSLGVVLFDYFSQAMRSLLDQIHQLLQVIPTKDKPAINYMTGMIIKTVESIDKIPNENKAAYRRYVLEKTLASKETLEEFDGYLKAAIENGFSKLSLDGNTLKAVDVDDDEDEDDEEDEEDEREYTSEEYKIVEKHVTMFRTTVDILKLTLVVITEVGDRINDETNTSTSEEAAKRKELQAESDMWIAKVVKQVGVIEGGVVDTGAELYPPIQTESVERIGNIFVNELLSLSTLLSESSKLLEFLSADKIVSLQQYHNTLLGYQK